MKCTRAQLNAEIALKGLAFKGAFSATRLAGTNPERLRDVISI